MDEWKYLVFTNGSARVFYKTDIHAAMVGDEDPRSAGYVRVKGGEVECYGESQSLRLGVHPDDARVLAALLGAKTSVH
jgi:hypothetical protein